MAKLPIFFNGPMVRATLAGTKTQTRRIIKLPHHNPLGQWEPSTFGGPGGGRTKSGDEVPLHACVWHTRTGYSISAPWTVGDTLWVRETFAFVAADKSGPMPDSAIYRADDNDGWTGQWRPSIHMPRWASRITLEVLSVKVERLQDISEADARAEGVEFGWRGSAGVEPHPGTDMTAVAAFRTLWKSLYGDDSWDANPWVWVCEFRKVTA